MMGILVVEVRHAEGSVDGGHVEEGEKPAAAPGQSLMLGLGWMRGCTNTHIQTPEPKPLSAGSLNLINYPWAV